MDATNALRGGERHKIAVELDDDDRVIDGEGERFRTGGRIGSRECGDAPESPRWPGVPTRRENDPEVSSDG